MGNDDLKNLKKEIIDEIIPHLDGEMTPEDRFKSYFGVAEALGNTDIIKKAFDAAKQIEDKVTRTEAMRDLLELVSIIEESQYQDDTELTNDNNINSTV
ncbi:MAG: hypothetical protein MUF85_00090 [Patescibacteria group bacterium]|jgi:hypothetical protein|nr:hypothetical protein [Patescibacteria group bacterium]